MAETAVERPWSDDTDRITRHAVDVAKYLVSKGMPARNEVSVLSAAFPKLLDAVPVPSGHRGQEHALSLQSHPLTNQPRASECRDQSGED